MAGCAACWRRRYDLSRTTTFSHHGRRLQALPAVIHSDGVVKKGGVRWVWSAVWFNFAKTRFLKSF
jgi:hypothetical protein